MSVSAAEPDADQSDNTATEPTTVVVASDLSFGKTGPATVAAGAPISWTITGNNAGPSVATNVTVTDNVPAGVTGITASGTGWSCSIAAQTVTCTRPSLAVGAAPAITISGTAPTTAQTLVNTCAATSAEPDPTPGGSCEATTIVQPVVDLSIVKTADQERVSAEQPLAWGIEVRNEGITAASSIAVTDTLPAGYVATTATGDGWTCAIAGQSVSCTRPTLAAGASGLIFIYGTAPAELGTLVNRVTVAAAEDEPNMANNEAEAAAEVIARGVEQPARPHVIPATDAWAKILLLLAVFGVAAAAIRRQ
ncbi:DUF11 domain-containing protein (plasmid) [Synechocystis sp. B12]|nr:DUF11 domain-containing protein [Synechocystis sp. B12]